MKYLPLLLIFNAFLSFSQETDKIRPSKKNALSIGFEAKHVFRGSTDQHYRIAVYGYDNPELSDKSFTQQYNFQLQYSSQYGFTRLTMGYLFDYVNLQQKSSSYWGDFGPDGNYYSYSSSHRTITVKERNRSVVMGLEYGGFLPSKSRWKLGGSLGFGYIHQYHNMILDNSYTGNYYYSSNTPNGSSSSSGSYSYDNQSLEWDHRVKKWNSAFLIPSINLLVNLKISDRFFLEFNASQRFLLKLKDGKVDQMKMQFPVGIGVRYQLF